jgi:hypothetical protein
MRKPIHEGAVAAVRSRRWQGTLTVVLLLGTAAGSCKKSNEASRPAPLAPGAAPVPGAPPAPPPPAGKAGEGAAGPTITGRITLAAARKGDVTPNDVVYLAARRLADNPKARGSLIAVKRFSASSFPIDFTLGAGDMMFKNGAFEGELTLSARIDKDGDPMTRRKGDVFGTIQKVKVGTAGVELALDQLQQEDESLLGGPPPAPGAGMPPGHP